VPAPKLRDDFPTESGLVPSEISTVKRLSCVESLAPEKTFDSIEVGHEYVATHALRRLRVSNERLSPSQHKFPDDFEVDAVNFVHYLYCAASVFRSKQRTHAKSSVNA
jgi:hypothetical protein